MVPHYNSVEEDQKGKHSSVRNRKQMRSYDPWRTFRRDVEKYSTLLVWPRTVTRLAALPKTASDIAVFVNR